MLERLAGGSAFPILVVVGFILAIWYVGAFFMNL
ncbi:MAG: ABC transporter permease, partial [Hyphomicrobiales bacterium]|nr:ABC transporter permease [Hyphomicrobiales bacterium]